MTLIVDDEAAARRGLRKYLASRVDIEIVGESSNGQEAVEFVRRHQPDLVFLDIQMPELNGFDVIADVGVHNMPATIFVTAYDEYALRAFDINAIDYVLKPVDPERLSTAVDRAVKHIDQNKLDQLRERLESVLDDVQERKNDESDKLVIRESGRVIFLPMNEVEWIESAGNYVKVNTIVKTYLLRETLQSILSRIDGRFIRVGRSAIVNRNHIRECRLQSRGTYIILLTGGVTVTSSRGYRMHVEKALGIV